MDGRRLVQVLLVAAFLAPAAAAQVSGPEMTLQVQPPTTPVKPDAETPSFLVIATVRCDVVLRAASPSAPQAPVPVSIGFQAQGGVAFAGPAELPIEPADCAPPATQATAQGVFQLSIPRSAPGLRPLPAVGTARVGTAESSSPFTVTADYYTVNEIRMDRKLGSCNAPCRLQFPLEVANLGNARTQYTFALASSPDGKWNAALPEVLLVDSANSGQGNSTGHAVVQVAVPVGGHAASFAITITPSAVDDPSKVGNPITVNLLGRNTNLASKATPGPALPMALLATAVALVLRRRA